MGTNIQKHFSVVQVTEHWHRLTGVAVVSLGDLHYLPGLGPGKPAVGVLAVGVSLGVWGVGTSRSPFQPQPFWDSV